MLSLRLQQSVQEGPQPSQPYYPSSSPLFPSCLPQTRSPPSPRLTPCLLPEVPAVPRLAAGLPSCCGVECGRGLRPRCRCPPNGKGGEGKRACLLQRPVPALVTSGCPLPPEPWAHMAPSILSPLGSSTEDVSYRPQKHADLRPAEQRGPTLHPPEESPISPKWRP